MNYVTYAIPFFVLLMAVECAWSHFSGKQTYRINDTLSSLYMGLLSRVVDLLRLSFASIAIAWLVSQAGVTTFAADSPWIYVGAFISYDFFYYWKHRFGHEWRILWASHVAHHQSEEFNLSTALRQTGTDYIGFVFYLPLFLAGLPAEVVITVGSLNLIYQFWVHTEHIRRLGPMEWIFVTPSNHRVHHAKNPEYIDRNYGGVFIVWDRLFGTFKTESDDNPCYYGITHALRSWDPIRANLHIWVETAQLAWRTRSWGDKLTIWFRPPSWSPADQQAPEDDWQAPKYNPDALVAVQWYCFGQYWLLTVAGLAAVILGNNFQLLLSIGCFALVAGSLYIHSQLLENHPQAPVWEWARLLVIAVASFAAPAVWSALPANITWVLLTYAALSAAVFTLNATSLRLEKAG